jgi:pimeloyl-ACP methyl ester carboxylesterase
MGISDEGASLEEDQERLPRANAASADAVDGISAVTVPFGEGHDLVMHVEGASGDPALLIHSVNAAASHAEMSALAHELSRDRRVYNLDLPGFGDSARPGLRYDIPRFVAAIHAAVSAIRRIEGERAVHAVALSLSCEFLARAAVEKPASFATLTFITPTGFQTGAGALTGEKGSTLERTWLAKLVAQPRIGRRFYELLTLPASIRFFLKRTFGSNHVDPLVLAAALRNSRAEGAEHAPLAFVTGRLFSGDVTTLYKRLELPVWAPYGTKGAFSDMSASAWTRTRANWRLQAVNSGAMPHVEHPESFAAEFRTHVAPYSSRIGMLAARAATGTAAG